MSQRGKSWSSEEKQIALKLYYRLNRQLRLVSELTGIPNSTIAAWVKNQEESDETEEFEAESKKDSSLFVLLESKIILLLVRILDWENLKDKIKEADLKDIIRFIEAIPKNVQNMTQFFSPIETSSSKSEELSEEDLEDLEDLDDIELRADQADLKLLHGDQTDN